MEKIWLASYQSGVPAEIDENYYPSLLDAFFESCEKYKSKAAMSHLGSRMTYNDWRKKSRDLAAFLQKKLGVKKGDRFAIMLPNMMQYPVALFAAMMAGMTIVNVNPLYTVPELVHQLNDSTPEVILVLSNFAHSLEQALPQTGVKHVIVTELGDLFSFPKSWIVNYSVKHIKKMVPAFQIPQAHDFRKIMSMGRSLTLDPVTLTGDDIAFLQYTGGTTGIAKGAVLTHRNMVANMEQAYAWVAKTLKPGQEIVITALPLYHVFSLLANCLLFMKLGAINVLITNPRDIPGFISELKRVNFTVITGVNTLFKALLNNPTFAQLNFKSLHFTLGGGMAIQDSVAEKWQKITGAPLIGAYGLTETSPAVTINPINSTAFNQSIGLPISSTDISIRDEAGHEAPINVPGELCVKGPQVMRGYWHDSLETEKVFMEGGWLKTGDIATIDLHGFLRIVDRKKDMILVSGFNVYPNEIENIIAAHPDVLEVAVIGVPDENTGEAVKAFIVRKNPDLTEKDIIAYCREQLTGYKIPKHVEFRNELLKSNIGKILRRGLK